MTTSPVQLSIPENRHMPEKANLAYVRLTKGSSFTTPWGQRLRAGQPARVSMDDPNLAYFRQSSRFRVTETISTPHTRRAKVRSKPKRARPAAPKKDSNEPKPLTRKQLVTAAKALGLTVKSSDNMDVIREMVEGHQVMLLEKAQKDAAAADASQTPTGDDTPPEGDDKPPTQE